MTKQNGRPNGQPEGMLRAYFSVSEKAAINEETRSVRVIASTSTADRMGRVVVQDWDLASFRANPILLWSHGEAGGYFGEVPDLDITLPIGFASDVSVEAGRLEATLNFVDEKANPLAAKVYEGIKQGSIRAVSAGWIPHDVRYEQHDGREVAVVSKNELLEISVVAIPANPEAVLAANFASLRARARPTPRHEVTMSAKLFAALGLSADAGDEALVASVETMTAERRELLAITGTASIREAVPVVAGWRERASQYDDVAAKYASLEAERREADVEKILDEGLRAGKRAIARDRSGLLKAAGATDDGKGANPASLKLIVAALPVEVQMNAEGAKTPAAPSAVTLTPSEKARCKRNGWSEAEYAAEKARVTGAPVEKVD